MNLVESLQNNNVRTENGMLTRKTSLSAAVDFFFFAGAMRSADEKRIISKFSKAYSENADIAMKLLFWLRDVRNGAGERRVFRIITKWMASNSSSNKNIIDSLKKNIQFIPEFGRWDDLLEFVSDNDIDNDIVNEVLMQIYNSLKESNGLCAKWMPRKGLKSSFLRKAFDLSPKEWRKLLVKLTDVVETKMCSGNWSDVKYDKIPSLALSRYKKAFYIHDEYGIKNYLDSLIKGTKKINVGAIYPYDIIRSLLSSNSATERSISNEQWKSLPNYLENSNERILAVVDTSGSMNNPIDRNKRSSMTCREVALSLGIYFSERNESCFKNAFITFSNKPTLQVLKGTLDQRIRQLDTAKWDMNTDLIKVFDEVLSHAVRDNVKQKHMPTCIIILSDMEFDGCVHNDKTAFKSIKEKYKKYNYEMPNIVFWNIQSRNDNIPVKFNKDGVGLVSGFSPSIVKSILQADVNPTKIMLNTIQSDRYNMITS